MWTCACVRAAHTPRSPATPGKCSAPNPNHRPPPSAPPQLGNLCFLTATPFLLISLRVILEASSRFKFTSSVSSARRPPFLSSLSHHLPSPRLLLVCLFLLPRSGSGVVQLPPTESRERKQRTGERNLGKVPLLMPDFLEVERPPFVTARSCQDQRFLSSPEPFSLSSHHTERLRP